MSTTTQATWRYAIGQRLQWGGARWGRWTVTQRRWVERQAMPPYAEYAIQGTWGYVHWVSEADLTSVPGTREPTP